MRLMIRLFLPLSSMGGGFGVKLFKSTNPFLIVPPDCYEIYLLGD
jgi:hypothetical protein